MGRKNEKDKIIEIAARVLSIEPTMLKEALENALEISVLKRDLQLLGDMLKNDRLKHQQEYETLEKLYQEQQHRCPKCGTFCIKRQG